MPTLPEMALYVADRAYRKSRDRVGDGDDVSFFRQTHGSFSRQTHGAFSHQIPWRLLVLHSNVCPRGRGDGDAHDDPAFFVSLGVRLSS